MARVILEVIEEFDSKRDYGLRIEPRYAKLLVSLKRGKFAPMSIF